VQEDRLRHGPRDIIEPQQWKSQPYRQGGPSAARWSRWSSLSKKGFEFGEMMRRTHENMLAEMLEKLLAYNISQIIPVRKKLSESQETERTAA
jgi:hypothetical protein